MCHCSRLGVSQFISIESNQNKNLLLIIWCTLQHRSQHWKRVAMHHWINKYVNAVCTYSTTNTKNSNIIYQQSNSNKLILYVQMQMNRSKDLIQWKKDWYMTITFIWNSFCIHLINETLLDCCLTSSRACLSFWRVSSLQSGDGDIEFKSSSEIFLIMP